MLSHNFFNNYFRDMQNVSVMFVCLGNICRSPMAEAVMKSQVKDTGLGDYIHIESSGTAGYHIGENADPRTLKILEANGISFRHSAQKLNENHFKSFDYLLVMDDENLRNTLNLKPVSSNNEVWKLLSFDESKSEADVGDPYYGGEDGFRHCFSQVDDACANFLQFLIEKHGFKQSTDK